MTTGLLKPLSHMYSIIDWTSGFQLWVRAGPKLGNAGPPEIIFRGFLKIFSWMVMQKSEPRRGDAKLGGLGACPSRKFCGI